MASPQKNMEQIFRRALRNGYRPIPDHEVTAVNVTIQTDTASYIGIYVKDEQGKKFGITVGLNDILFSHDFARAIWGDKIMWQPTSGTHPEMFEMPIYKFHLWQLAMISTIRGRLSYYAANLPKLQRRAR